jgi:alpha-L-rhamnosidase
MNASFIKNGLLFLGFTLALFSAIDAEAREVEFIKNADWITCEWPAAMLAEQKKFGSPGAHGQKGNPTLSGVNLPLPIFRNSFTLDDAAISSAQVEVCGLGHFELSVNGQKVGDHFLDPPWSDYAETCYTVRFDIAKLLKPGENVLSVMLGNGMYNVMGGRYTKFTGSFGPPKLILALEVTQGERKQIITTDETWKTDAGPITFSCMFGGEDFDARKEQPGWDRPGFDDSQWKPVKVVKGPGGRLRPATSPPIKVIRRIRPASITKLKDGRYEIDLGENLSSRPVIQVKGKAGSRVTIETAERKGKLWKGHSYTYTLKGEGEPESFEPRFTYFGFQYIYVGGVEWGNDVNRDGRLPELIDVGADFVSSCSPRIGDFACGNPLLNEIDAMIDRSVASNLQHVLTDCPHREKQGWLEVSHLMGPSILFNYDMGELYRKICRDTTDSQLKNGSVPDIAPEYVRFDGGFFESPEWGSASVQLPWLIHRWYGDQRILSEQYTTMAAYTDYLAGTRNEAGLVKGGLGDWYDWTPEQGHGSGLPKLTPKELPATCMLYDNARILRQAAAMQGKAAEEEKWQKLMDETRRDFQAAYYDQKNKTVATGSQSALALGLYFGLVPDADRGAVLAKLVSNLEKSQYRQSTGEVCFRYMVMVLAEAGRSDLVYRMINRTNAPGYGYLLEQGLKTLSERWDRRPGSSLNHCMFGHIQEWFMKYLLGIRQAPGSTGFEKVIIDPFVPEGLDWAKGSFDSPNGRIEVTWVSNDATAKLTIKAEKENVVVPPGKKNSQWDAIEVIIDKDLKSR